MRIADWIMAKKKKRAAAKQQRLAAKRGVQLEPTLELEPDVDGITPPESRFTEEYKEFLEQESANAASAGENAADCINDVAP